MAGPSGQQIRMPMMGQGGMMGGPGPQNQSHPGLQPNPNQILQNQMSQNSPGPGGPSSQGPQNPGSHPGHPHHQQQQQQQQQAGGPQQAQGGGPSNPQEQPKVDSISRAKILFPTLKESVQNVFKTTADALSANVLVDFGIKAVELDPSISDKAVEEFYSVCDHMEIHLKSAMECLTQNSMTQQNLPVPVSQTKMDGALTYANYVAVVQSQIKYAKEVHDAMADAANKMLE